MKVMEEGSYSLGWHKGGSESRYLCGTDSIQDRIHKQTQGCGLKMPGISPSHKPQLCIPHL